MGATLSFEDGKIVATSTTYTNPLVSNLLNRYAGPTVNLSMIEHYPSENINMILMASFNPEIFEGILKEMEVEGLVNSFMEKTGFSTKELYQSLKGDIAVVVSDLGKPEKEIKVKDDSTLTWSRNTVGKMIFSAPVGNPTNFIKIMNKGVEMGYFNKQGNVFKAGKLLTFLGMYMQADEKNLIIASDSITYAQYVSNKNRAMISNDALNMFKGKSTVCYIDIANTIKSFFNKADGDYKNSIGSAKQVFKDMIVSTDNYKDGAIKGRVEVRLKDEKQNSLVTLTGLFTDLATDMRVAARKESEQTMFPSGVPAIIRTN
jgi:DNA-directed RNA polymerase delta subunit